MWHCHFLEHEDHDMMRPILVINNVHPVQQPHAGEEHTTSMPTVTTSPLINPSQSKVPTENAENTAETHENHVGNAKPTLSKYLQNQSMKQRQPSNKKRNKRQS